MRPASSRAAPPYRFPRRKRADFDALVVSVVASVPLVALANGLADLVNTDRAIGDLKYVAILLVASIVAGYGAAAVRGTGLARGALAALGLRRAPEHSVAELVLARLPEDSLVYVNLKDGRALAGNPSAWTLDPEATTRELYVHFPQWWLEEEAKWGDPDDDGGVLLDLGEVHSIQVTTDPKRAASNTP